MTPEIDGHQRHASQSHHCEWRCVTETPTTGQGSEAEFDSRWFWSVRLFHRSTLGRGRGLRAEVVFANPGGERLSEELVRSASVLELAGGVDERGG
jgi:hypothetical protein